MKSTYSITFIGFALFLFFSSCGEYKKGISEEEHNRPKYENPLPIALGDPYILNDGSGTFYMYGTGGADNGFVTYSSKDLINWNNEGQVYKAGEGEGSWAVGSFWAPEVYMFGDKYYMFFSAQWRDNPNDDLENFRIGVAVADNPTGPFKDLEDQPIFDPGYPIIDANVFKDDDGRFYLFYSRVCYEHPVESEVAEWAREKGWFDEIEESWVYGVELEKDFKDIKGEPVLMLRPPETMDDMNAEWESRSVTSREVNRRWTEGSFTFKNDGIYYMMYSANFFGGENYAVGYATASSVLGPYRKSDHNPILEKNTGVGGEVTGTGHNSLLFLEDSTRIFSVYHGRTEATGEDRVVFIDEMEINDEGVLSINGPTTEPVPSPIVEKMN